MEKRPKYGGRKKGSANKITSISREAISELTNTMMPTVLENLKSLSAKDYVSVWIELNKFIIPKPQSIDMNVNAPQAQPLIDRLLQLSKENE